jgi:hypothetical protein
MFVFGYVSTRMLKRGLSVPPKLDSASATSPPNARNRNSAIGTEIVRRDNSRSAESANACPMLAIELAGGLSRPGTLSVPYWV